MSRDRCAPGTGKPLLASLLVLGSLGLVGRSDTIAWDVDGSGSFGVAANWDPAMVPDVADVARFDRGDLSYTVSFAGIDRTNTQLIVADDAVTFDLGGAAYEAAGGFFIKSVVIGESAGPAFLSDTASLSIENGTFIGQSVILGQSAVANNFPPPIYYRSSGVFNVDGSAGDPTVEVNNELVIGDAGSGALNIMAGGQVQSNPGLRHDATIADEVSAVGTANIDGADGADISTWDDLASLKVGNQGSGNLNVTNGGRVFAQKVFLAGQSEATANVLIELATGFFQSQLNVSEELYVGGSALSAGGTADVMIGVDGRLSGTATKIWDTGTVTLDGGTFSVNTLELAAGGSFDWQSGRFRIADFQVNSGATLGDSLTIDSARELEIKNLLTVGASGTLTLDGGLLIADALDIDGAFNWNSGTLQKTSDLVVEPGGDLGDNLMVENAQTLVVRHLTLPFMGNLRVGDSGAGMVHVAQGGTVTTNDIILGGSSAGDGTLCVTDAGTTVDITRQLTVGDAGVGRLEMDGAAIVTSEFATIARLANSEGTVTLAGDGAMWHVMTDAAGQTTLPVGLAGTGTVNVRANTTVQTLWHDIVLGEEATGSGTVNISGPNAAWILLNAPADTFTVGLRGSAALNVSGGGLLASGKGFIAFDTDSEGTVQVTGEDSQWQPLFLDVGGDGDAHLLVGDAGKVMTQEVFAGAGPNSEGHIDVDGTGSVLAVDAPDDNNIVLGVEGVASLDVTGGGRVEVGGLFVGDGETASATASLTDPGSSIEAGELVVGFAGTGTFNINGGLAHAQDAAIAVFDTATGTVHVADNGGWSVQDSLFVGGGMEAGGDGELHLHADGQVDVGSLLRIWPSGTVNVAGGALIATTVDHSLGGQFNLSDGTLAVDVFDGTLDNAGGVVAPGTSAGVTHITGDFMQAAPGVIDVELFAGGGAPGVDFDQVTVDGTATLGGDLAVHLAGGYRPGSEDTFTVLTAAELLGALDNVASGGRLRTAGTPGSFLVLYDNVSDAIVLSNFLLTGDMDCDGDTDFDDIDDLVLGLNDPITYENTYGVPAFIKGDSDGDGDLDFDDISGFVSLLADPGSAAVRNVPEPRSAWALLIGGALLMSGRWRPVCQSVLGIR